MLPAWVLEASTLWASGPARWKLNPAGAPAMAKLTRIPCTTVPGSGLLLDADGATLTRAWAALPSLEVPSSLTRVTPGTRRAASRTRVIAALSAAVSGPDARSATMIAVPDGLRPWKSVASRAACTLELDDERNWALLDRVTLDRLGSRPTPATTPTIQTATIGQRAHAMLSYVTVVPFASAHAGRTPWSRCRGGERRGLGTGGDNHQRSEPVVPCGTLCVASCVPREGWHAGWHP
jgi:hypothetical protein